MKLSSLLICSIAGTASSTVLIGDQYGQLYKMMDLTSGIATPFLNPVGGFESIAKDTLTGKIFLTGHIDGKGWVKEVCGGAIKDITTLPSGVSLDCITGGPSGVLALNSADNSYGVLSDCGTYTKIGTLPAPYDSYDGYVFVQDEKGQLHVIDVNGNYYTQIAQCGWVKQPTHFTPKHEGYCGYFKPDASRGTIYTSYTGKSEAIGTFNLANGHKGTLDIKGLAWLGIGNNYIYDLAVDVDTNRICATCTPTAPTAPTPTTPTICPPTAPTKPTPTGPTKPTPTAPSAKKAGKKASSQFSKGGKKSYSSHGSMMTGLMNTTEFNATLGYFN